MMQNADGASGKCANEKWTKQTWSVGDGNGVDLRPIIRFETGFSEGSMNDW